MISYSRESYFKGIVARMPINEQQRTFSASSNELFEFFCHIILTIRML